MKLHAHFLNEGATLIIEGHGCRLAVQTTAENMADCEAVAAVIHSLTTQHGGQGTRTAGMVREVGPWRMASDDEAEETT